MIRQSDIDAVAKAIDPHVFNEAGQSDKDAWMPQDIQGVREKRRHARRLAKAAILTLQARGWRDEPW